MTGYLSGRWALILGWLAAPLVLFLPLFAVNPVTFWGCSDALFYTNILSLMSRSAAAGEWFPHWLADANAGLGNPVMLFYAPLAYSITVLLTLPLAPLHPAVETQLLVGMYASQVVSGYTAFLWLKQSFSRRIAFIGSLAFVVLPYKFVYIYGHINLAQLWALAFLPLWMLAAQQMLAGGRRPVGLYALACAATYYTHTLTVIAFGFVPAGYVLWFGRGENWRRSYALLALAHVLALAICLVKALPQHYDLSWIHPEGFLEGRLNWSNNLYHIDVLLCGYYGLITLIGCEMWQNPELRKQMPPRVGMLWVLVVCVVLFLMEPLSTFVWRHVVLLQYLQFPSARLHACMLMAVVYLLCCWLTYYPVLLPRAKLVYHKATMAALIAVYAATTLLYLHSVLSIPNDLSQDYILDMHAASIIVPPEYKTHWNCINVPDAYRMYAQHAVPEPVATVSGKAAFSSLVWQPPGRIAFTADVQSRDAEIAVRQCYFPLWKAEDESGQSIALTAGNVNGLLTFTLPKGTHAVSLHFAESARDRIAGWISALALIISLALLLVRSAAGLPKKTRLNHGKTPPYLLE